MSMAAVWAQPAWQTVQAEVTTMLAAPVDVPPAGLVLEEAWRPVAGATGASVGSAVVRVTPATGAPRRSLGVAAPAARAASLTVRNPVPSAPLRALDLGPLARFIPDGDNEIAITLDGEGPLDGRRLAVAPVVAGAVQAPVVTAPALAARGAVPAQLTGARLSGHVLELPDLVATELRVTLVSGEDPTAFVAEDLAHGDVTAYAAPMPVGLHVEGPDGAEQHAVAGPLTREVDLDVTAAVSRALDAAAVAGGPLGPRVTLRSDAVGAAHVRLDVSGGSIVRTLGAPLTAELDGSPASLAVPAPHPGRAPLATHATVTVTHHGIALHPVSDPLPTVEAGLSGPAVRSAGVTRALPPAALSGQVLRRVGVVGWPRELTDLTVEVLGARATVEGLAPARGRTAPVLVWFDVGTLEVSAPVELRLTATRGAFDWVASPEPLVRIGVACTPERERVTVGGRAIDLTGARTTVATDLAGTDRFDVTTDQFCTVTLTDAVMRFAP